MTSEGSSPVAGRSSSGRELVLGLVVEKDLQAQPPEAIEDLEHYLEQRLARPVQSRLFDSQSALYEWLTRFREVDAAWLSDAFLHSRPGGQVVPLAQYASSIGEHSEGRFVVRQDMQNGLREQLRSVLLDMHQTAQGQSLLTAMALERFQPLPELPLPFGVPAPFVRLAESPATDSPAPVAAAKPDAARSDFAARRAPEPERVSAETLQPVESTPVAETAPSPAPDRPRTAEVSAQVDPVVPQAAEASGLRTDSRRDQVEEEIGAGAQSPALSAPEAATTPRQQTLAGLFEITEVEVLIDQDSRYAESLFAEQRPETDVDLLYDGRTNLLRSIQVGRNFNRESLAALARTEQATAQTRQARSQLLPQASLRLSRGQETAKPSVEIDEISGELVESSTHTRTDAAFVLRQPLFDLPSYLDWQRRQEIEDARGENYRGSDGDAFLATVNAYLALVATRLQMDVTRDFEAQLIDLFDYIEKRTNAGASSVSEMARVEARRVSMESFRLEQESAHTTAWLDFVRLTNLAPERLRLPVPADVGAAALPEKFSAAVTAALDRNPEIAALRAELEAAKIDRSAARGRYLPRLDAEYSYNYSQHAGGEPNPDGQRDERIMAVLSWDLFNSGRDLYYHRERSARHSELLYRLDDQRRRVVQALSANYSALGTINERLAAGYHELRSISTAAEAMSKRMLSGNQSLLDLLDVYDRLFQARSRLIDLHIQEINTSAQLVRLTYGNPDEGS